MQQANSEILFEEMLGCDGNLGVITLNRPQVLNALNHTMLQLLGQQLNLWESSSSIKAVIIRSADGRAFCAGGDIRSIYEKKLANNHSAIIDYFCNEYEVNQHIFHYAKPYIAFLDGITMGGGAGISIHGSHRVATERFIFAMPETGIGFFPDVGATYFLSRLPHKIGIYLGLTGVKIAYNDCYALGLVDYIISTASQEKVLQTFIDTALPNNTTINTIIKNFSIPAPHATLLLHQKEIATCFAKTSIAEIMTALDATPSEFCKATSALLKTRSPTSLKLTLEALIRAEKLDFDESMKMQYELMHYFIQAPDFFEGIRATIIDKDFSPQWSEKIN